MNEANQVLISMELRKTRHKASQGKWESGWSQKDQKALPRPKEEANNSMQETLACAKALWWMRAWWALRARRCSVKFKHRTGDGREMLWSNNNNQNLEQLRSAGNRSKLCTTLGGRYYTYSHFIDEEIEAQVVEGTCSNHRLNERQN